MYKLGVRSMSVVHYAIGSNTLGVVITEKGFVCDGHLVTVETVEEWLKRCGKSIWQKNSQVWQRIRRI